VDQAREARQFAPAVGTTPHLVEPWPVHSEFTGDSPSYAIHPDQAMGRLFLLIEFNEFYFPMLHKAIA
jgi:hypothetical protein